MSAVKLGGEKSLASTVVTIQKDQGSSEFVMTIPNFTIGRSVTCDIKVNELVVSRIHLAVEIKYSRVFITDKNSSLGTFVNDIRIAPMTETQVKASDRVKVGDSILWFKLDGDAIEKTESNSEIEIQSETGSFHVEDHIPGIPDLKILRAESTDDTLREFDDAGDLRAQKLLNDAIREATTIVSNAEKQATGILSTAEKSARKITDGAYEKAEKILEDNSLEVKKLLEKARDEAVLLKTNQVQANERLFKETMDRASQLQEKFAAEGQRLRAQSQAEADLLISRARDEAARVREHTTKEMALLKSQVSADADFLIEEGERARTQGHEEAKRQLAKAREDIDLAHEQAIKDTEFLRSQVLSETKRAQALAEAAETEARTMIEQARIESGNLKNQALQESQKRLQQATDQANERHHNLLIEVEELRSEANHEVTAALANAKKEAARIKLEAQEESDRLRKLVKSEAELAHKHALAEAHEKANRELAQVYSEIDEQKLKLTNVCEDLKQQIQSRQIEFEKLVFDSNAQEQFLTHTLTQVTDAQIQAAKQNEASDIASKKSQATREELTKLEERHAVLLRGYADLEQKKKSIQDEISVETKRATDKLQDAVRDFQKQRDAKIQALIEENDKEAARLKSELVKSVQDQRFRMAQVIHQRLWKRLLQTLSEDQFEKLDEVSLDEINEGIQEHLASYSTEPTANLVSQKTAMQRQQRRNSKWLALGLTMGLAIGGAAYTVQEHLRAADLNAVLAKEQSQRSEELAARKYQPAQDLRVRETYADSVIFTQNFVQIYSDDDVQARWVKVATQYMYKQWKVDEEKTVEAISMLRTLVQVLESQRQKIHPDFVQQGRKKMDEHEEQTIQKVREVLGTAVKFEAYRRLEMKFISDELGKKTDIK
jgi:pSer/pThr/pTyr-binding forkhead associated (FHA) protein